MGWRKFSGAGYAVVEVQGTLDQASCHEFSDFLCSAAAEASSRGDSLKIDLSGLRQISSHGLRALAHLRHEAGDALRITLTCPQGSIREILTISRMDELFRVED